MLTIDSQMLYYVFNLNDIENKKNFQKLTCIEVFKLLNSDTGADFNLFKIAFDNCEDEDVAKEKMNEYVNGGSLDLDDDNKEDLNTEGNSIGDKNNDDKFIMNINIVVQFLTKYAKEKYSKDHENAIKEIALIRTEDGISTGDGTKYFDLIPVFKKADRFGRWSLDPLFGHLKVYLVNIDESYFPLTWQLNREETKFSFIFEEVFMENFVSIIKANKADKKQLDGFFTEILKYDKIETENVLKCLRGHFIYKLKDLQSLTDEGWKILFNLMPSRADEIREEIDKLDNDTTTTNSSKMKPKDEFEQSSDWHKLERFLFYKANMHDRLKKTGYLNIDALKKNFENERKVKSFNIDPILLDELQKRFSSFCIADEHNIKMNRGMLFYGPPGTGKTQLMKLIIRISGLTKYVEPLGSSELNRGYVGETEALLRDIFRRASYFPSIMFCIAIDEIDSLVPKRESKNENASKKDIVNQLLALIEGASDIKNVYLIGATNHLSKIDKAFARRMQDKFYIGFLNMNERLTLIKTINNDFKDKSDSIKFTYDLDRLIEIMSINFSGAAASELKTKLKTEYFLCTKKPFKLDKKLLTKLANDIVKSHDIKFGGLSIPDLFSSIPDEDLNDNLDFWKKFDNSFKYCTGRVVINLDEEIKSIQFELDSEKVNKISKFNNLNFMKDDQLIEIGLSKTDKFIKNILKYVLFFTIYSKINFVKLIDSSFMKQSGGDDDNPGASANAIMSFYEEFREYNDGVLVFNADEIVGINESGSIETGFDREKYNTGIIDQAVWSKAINSIFSSKDENLNEDESPKKWHVFVTTSKFLNDSFKHLFKFPLTKFEDENKKKEENNRLEEHKCLNCDKKYIEDENKVDSCSYHPNLLMSKLSTGNNIMGVTKEQVLQLARSRPNEEITKEFVYYCCLKAFDSDGCTKDKHSYEEKKIEINFDKKVKTTWLDNDNKILIKKKNDQIWLDQRNNEFKVIEEKYDELILYNDKEKVYYKLNSVNIKTGKSINNITNDLALGKWIYNKT